MNKKNNTKFKTCRERVEPIQNSKFLKRVLLFSLLGLGFVLGLASLAMRDKIVYLHQAAVGQAGLIMNGQSIQELLAKPDLEPGLKRKLERVQSVKAFAEGYLGLKPTQNYQKYIDVKRDWLVLVLSASPPLKFESHSWWFPIVGTVPYLGFYDEKLARQQEKELQAQGLETHLRGASAYSTLGWFHDPLLSTMIHGDEFHLVNTVIHESTHATLFIPGEITFNENLATFVGNKGAFAYYAHHFGKDSEQYRQAENRLQDSDVFNTFLAKLYQELDTIYRSKQPNPAKDRAKGEKIEVLKQEYEKTVTGQFKTEGYKKFASQKWNNAMIMAYQNYHQDFEKFEKLYQQQGADLKKLMTYVQTRKDSIVKDL